MEIYVGVGTSGLSTCVFVNNLLSGMFGTVSTGVFSETDTLQGKHFLGKDSEAHWMVTLALTLH